MEKLIGREHERLLFQKYIASNRCEFIAVYGRRRVSICEMKYSQADYSFNKSEYNKMQNRINTFRTETNCRKGIQPVLITTYSLLKNEYSHIVNRVVVMDDLYTDIKEE